MKTAKMISQKPVNRPMKISLFISFIFCDLMLLSFKWPLSDARITATFGESRWDHFHNGMDLAGTDAAVTPIAPGKLLFYWDKSIFPLDNYPGGGNYQVISHIGGIKSIYMHLEDGVNTNAVIGEADKIGVMGNTGHSFSRHLHISVLDSNKKLSLNPISIMNKVEDKKLPDIGEIGFRIADKSVFIKNGANIRLTRHYPLLISVRDAIKGYEKLGVFNLVVEANGKKITDISFNSINYASGSLLLNKKPYEYYYDESGNYKAEGIIYQEGENVFNIKAADYSGNTAEKSFKISIRLDMESR
jgi:hypothetical protein